MATTTATSADTGEEPAYLTGFGNEHQSEALPGALPIGQFSPQRGPLGLYAEQFSTTAFTAPRAHNRRTWFYRIRPSVTQGRYEAMLGNDMRTAPDADARATPEPLRWDPWPIPTHKADFVDGLTTIATNGDAHAQYGTAVHVYAANRSMTERYFYNADGELLLVAQQGGLRIRTECGVLHVTPGEIAVLPRGLKFQVQLLDVPVRGYVCENYGLPLELPERGPVGANGFANTRDFVYPTAAFEDTSGDMELVCKFAGQLYRCALSHSPLDVVAWVGNSAPYKYDLARFNVINTVSFDHPDPSIFTVLTSPSHTSGVANLDFVIFPPRWMVAEHTFRPPWFHRNVMSEFMGLIRGSYDAKQTGFVPGGFSVHNSMTPHGPDAAAFNKAITAELTPERYENSLAFMFESRYAFAVSAAAMRLPQRQRDYADVWRGLTSRFLQ